MKKIYMLLILLILSAVFVGCGNKRETETETTLESKTQKDVVTTKEQTTTLTTETSTSEQEGESKDMLQTLVYANLVDEESKALLKQALLTANISVDKVDSFFKIVDEYNAAVGEVGLVKEGFTESDNIVPEYDVIKIDENWLEKYPNFIGNNCRLTTFDLINELVYIEKPDIKENSILFMDEVALADRPYNTYDEKERMRFNTFFGTVPAEDTKDVQIHLKNVKKYLSDKGITYSGKASVITVWLHSELDKVLFVGHTGILVDNPNDESLLFVEKISFQEPYQLIKFSDRVALNDYLMNKYDTSYNQPTAKPFIMENDELLEGYRPNLNNKED